MKSRKHDPAYSWDMGLEAWAYFTDPHELKDLNVNYATAIKAWNWIQNDCDKYHENLEPDFGG